MFVSNLGKQQYLRVQTTEILQVAKLQKEDLTNNVQRFNAVKNKIVSFYQTSATLPCATET